MPVIVVVDKDWLLKNMDELEKKEGDLQGKIVIKLPVEFIDEIGMTSKGKIHVAVKRDEASIYIFAPLSVKQAGRLVREIESLYKGHYGDD